MTSILKSLFDIIKLSNQKSETRDADCRGHGFLLMLKFYQAKFFKRFSNIGNLIFSTKIHDHRPSAYYLTIMGLNNIWTNKLLGNSFIFVLHFGSLTISQTMELGIKVPS